MVQGRLNKPVPAYLLCKPEFHNAIIPSISYNTCYYRWLSFFVHVTNAQTRTPAVCFFVCSLKEADLLPILQSGFAVTLSLRGPREGEARLPSEWPGSLSVGCLSAHSQACDVWCTAWGWEDRWEEGMAGRLKKKEAGTGENNTRTGGSGTVGTTITRFIIPFTTKISFLRTTGGTIQSNSVELPEELITILTPPRLHCTWQDKRAEVGLLIRQILSWLNVYCITSG